jgi:hypothetical protein
LFLLGVVGFERAFIGDLLAAGGEGASGREGSDSDGEEELFHRTIVF